MSRISSLYLADIAESCERIHRYIDGVEFDDFILDEMRVDAVARNLEIIGEAVKNVPVEIRQLRPEIEWKKIARFRDIIAHHYFKIDYERVWDIARNKVSDLRSAAREMLEVTAAREGLDNPE